ncbi:hypothetical protein [Halomonas caseinilytica]|uniref:Uncharacterized protein n=1 Tax=Halomonas caseinilytica TaxID=438744 RepID=A0A1M6MWU0_9GAMM|nr:hypothetical protein [Halomonas caseinilytica]SEM33882.1 hypothetical protein SAMN04487952_10361 [Halomonas caseinilytica]SHJ87850.1 hypothetical protein SAMN05192556_101191 [Halomonas caseinilytica]
MGRLLSLIVIIALAYGGLYVTYGMALKDDVAQAITDIGLGTVEVDGIDYGPLAPLGTEARITAEVRYQGASATVDLGLHGHPLFSEETRLELGGLQALRLTIGAEP